EKFVARCEVDASGKERSDWVFAVCQHFITDCTAINEVTFRFCRAEAEGKEIAFICGLVDARDLPCEAVEDLSLMCGAVGRVSSGDNRFIKGTYEDGVLWHCRENNHGCRQHSFNGFSALLPSI